MALLWIFALILPAIYAGVESPKQYLFGKNQEIIRQYTVRLVRPQDGEMRTFCSGILHGPGEILTAGHCLSEKNAANIFVEIYDLKTKAYKRYPATGGTFAFNRVKDSQNPPIGKDIGLLKFDSKNANFPQMSLPQTDKCDSNKIIQAGFGTDESRKTGNLNFNYYEIADTNDGTVLEDEISFASKVGKACGGDSGSPLYCMSNGRLSILAITSMMASGAGTAIKTDDVVKRCKVRRYLRATEVLQLRKHLSDDYLTEEVPTEDVLK